MRLYFSGVSSEAEAAMLAEADVSYWLADPRDARNVPPGVNFALDSGAYRAWKGKTTVEQAAYLRYVEATMRPLDFAIAPDVLGDPGRTMANWLNYGKPARRSGLPIIPVWPWGAPEEHLYQYLDDSPQVAIGALVPWCRAKSEPDLILLIALCDAFPGRFHLLGLNWLRAIEALRGTAASADTSKWLDAGRYAHLIFVNTRTGHLSQAPARALGVDYDRARRCVESARAMEAFCTPRATIPRLSTLDQNGNSRTHPTGRGGQATGRGRKAHAR